MATTQNGQARAAESRTEITFSVPRVGAVGKTSVKMWCYKVGNWQDFAEWRLDYNEFCIFMSYGPGSMQARYMDVRTLLRGDALVQFNHEHLVTQGGLASAARLTACLDALSARYSRRGRRLLNELLKSDEVKKKPGETVAVHFAKMSRLFRIAVFMPDDPVPFTDTAQFYAIQDTLPMEWRNHLLRSGRDITNVEEALSYYQNVENSEELTRRRNNLRQGAMRGGARFGNRFRRGPFPHPPARHQGGANFMRAPGQARRFCNICRSNRHDTNFHPRFANNPRGRGRIPGYSHGGTGRRVRPPGNGNRGGNPGGNNTTQANAMQEEEENNLPEEEEIDYGEHLQDLYEDMMVMNFNDPEDEGEYADHFEETEENSLTPDGIYENFNVMFGVTVNEYFNELAEEDSFSAEEVEEADEEDDSSDSESESDASDAESDMENILDETLEELFSEIAEEEDFTQSPIQRVTSSGGGRRQLSPRRPRLPQPTQPNPPTAAQTGTTPAVIPAHADEHGEEEILLNPSNEGTEEILLDLNAPIVVPITPAQPAQALPVQRNLSYTPPSMTPPDSPVTPVSGNTSGLTPQMQQMHMFLGLLSQTMPGVQNPNVTTTSSAPAKTRGSSQGLTPTLSRETGVEELTTPGAISDIGSPTASQTSQSSQRRSLLSFLRTSPEEKAEKERNRQLRKQQKEIEKYEKKLEKARRKAPIIQETCKTPVIRKKDDSDDEDNGEEEKSADKSSFASRISFTTPLAEKTGQRKSQRLQEQNKESQENIMSFTCQLQDTKRMVLELPIIIVIDKKRITLMALLDTGCGKSSVREELVKNSNKLIQEKVVYTQADGSTFASLYSILLMYLLPEFSSNRTIISKFQVAKTLTYPVVIGLDIIFEQQFVFNFKTKEIEWDSISRKMHEPTSVYARKEHIPEILDSLQYQFNAIHSGFIEKEEVYERTKSYLELENENFDFSTYKNDNLNPEELQQLRELLMSYDGTCINQPIGTLNNEPDFRLELKPNAVPYFTKPYPIPQIMYEKGKLELERLIGLGVLEKDVSSSWAAPAFFTYKPDGRVRLLTDFRQLNKNLVRHYYPLPKIHDLLHSLQKPDWISSIDLVMGYYARIIDPLYRYLTAFVVPWGKYRYVRLGMGLFPAVDEFQSVMDKNFGDLKFARVYMDDLLIFTVGDFTLHLQQIKIVLDRMEKIGLVIRVSKSHFATQEVNYLGYVISVDGIKPQMKKVEAITKIQAPKTRKQLRGFLGIINFYRDLWPRRAHIVSPLSELCSNKKKFEWNEKCQQAFDQIKEVVKKEVLLNYIDFNKTFEILVDASKIQMGGIIQQDKKPLVFWSKKKTETQQKYSTMKSEMLSIIEILKEYRNILLGRKIIIYTDHSNLTFSNFTNGQLYRWRLMIEEFSPEIKHIKGSDNQVADALSRLPMINKGYTEEHNKLLLASEINNENIMELKTIKSYQMKDKDIQNKLKEKEYFEKEISSIVIIVNKDGKIVLPKEIVKSFCQLYHDFLLHPGITRLGNTISQVFYYSGLYQVCKDIIEGCEKCRLFKRSNKYNQYGKIPVPEIVEDSVWNTIQVDSVGPLFKDKRLLTMIDVVSGLCELDALMDYSSAESAASFDKTWLCRYPRPSKVIHDQGTEFQGEFIELLESYGIENCVTTIRNPRANSIVERVHGVINEMFRTAELTEENWKDILPNISFALRSTYSSRTESSPGAVAFHRDMLYDIKHFTNYEYLHQKKIKEIRENIEKENKHRKEYQFQPGQQVTIKLDKKIAGKMETLQLGPYELVAVRNNGTIIVNKGNYMETWNIRNVLPYQVKPLGQNVVNPIRGTGNLNKHMGSKKGKNKKVVRFMEGK